MEFINEVNEIGKKNNDLDTVKKVLKLIEDKYKYNSRPVKATIAKKELLKNNLISEEVADRIKFPKITEQLKKERNEKLENQETMEISKEVFDDLLEYKDSQDEELFLYLLLVSGLRISDLYNGNFRIVDSKLMIDKLSKKPLNSKKEYHIQLILIKPNEFIKLLKKFRDKYSSISKSVLNRKLNRRLERFNLSVHNLRAIYLFYHLKINKTLRNKPTHVRVKKLLNHKDFISGAHYENKINIEGLQVPLHKMTVKELRALAKEKGLRRYSRLRKQELIDLIKTAM